MTAIRRGVFVLVLVVVTLAPRFAPAAGDLKHLGGVEELKSWFNAGKGHPRLIFLLSPT